MTGLTPGIITPMTITVTCASGGMEAPDSPDREVIEIESSDPDELAQGLNTAALRSWQRAGSPVYVSIIAD